jgi:hypothetical protein
MNQFKPYLIFGGSRQALIFLLHPIYFLFHTSAWQIRSLERFGLGSRGYIMAWVWWYVHLSRKAFAAGVGKRIGSNQSGVWRCTIL